MIPKRLYSPGELHYDCGRIAQQLFNANYYPDYWIALDRGGVIAAAVIRREFQNLVKDHKSHLIIKHKDDNWADIQPFHVHQTVEKKVLLVDDIIDYGDQYIKSISEFDRLRNFYQFQERVFDWRKHVQPRTKHAALIWNETNRSGVRADFYGQKIDKLNNPEDNVWFKFFWEGE